MNLDHHNTVAQSIRSIFADRIKMSVSEWCEKFLIFDEPDNRGPYSLIGREYAREPLDSWSDSTITDGVSLFGSQSGKTGMMMGGAAYTLVNEPARVIWVMPNENLAQTFSETRWLPMLRRSPTTEELLPSGAKRHDLRKLQQTVGHGIVNFYGSNSPANLSSNPARIAILDEVDKFNEGGGKEADAVSLAEQRTKKFSNPKRYKSSTPTLTDGLIWQEFLKTDQRRRFLPCPSCGKFVVLVWSKDFTILPSTGCDAFIRWDKEAKRADGTWDLDRVEKSARAECPHCGCHIRDGQKTAMDRAGEWRATAPAARGYRGWHLPSLYASSSETTFGKLAVKFLQAKRSLMGLQGFINGDLAEPWESQDTRSERVEVIVTGESRLAESLPIMTVDVQATSPFFYIVVRDWQLGPSRLVSATHVDTWEDVREVQLKHGVKDNHVAVDSGFKAEEVYDHCTRYGKLIQLGHGRPVWVGWMPCKGREKEATWRDKLTKQPRPFGMPEDGAALPHRKFKLNLLEFNGPFLKDSLARMRKHAKPHKWELNETATEEYFRHLDSEVKKPVAAGRTGRIVFEWQLRSARWPNHWLDCEVMQLAMALLNKRLTWADHGGTEQNNAPTNPPV